MKTPPPYDCENLTEQQYGALLAFAVPLAFALKVGVPSSAIIEHVTHCLDKAKARLPELK